MSHDLPTYLFEIINTFQSSTGSSNLRGCMTQVHSRVQTTKKKTQTKSQQTTDEVTPRSWAARATTTEKKKDGSGDNTWQQGEGK
jgi:hypothetical protein